MGIELTTVVYTDCLPVCATFSITYITMDTMEIELFLWKNIYGKDKENEHSDF